jgi:hypothetical protein
MERYHTARIPSPTPNNIVGMVFVDANQENHFYHRHEPMPEFGVYQAPWQKAIDKDLNFLEAASLERDRKLSPEDWTAHGRDRDRPSHEAASRAEFRGWQKDAAVLAVKKQFEKRPLEDYPVGVLRADSKMEWQRMYDAGVAGGGGTGEERASYREMIGNWDERDGPVHEKLLRLSTVGRFRTVKKSGHCIHMVNLEAVAEEVKWFIDQISGN